MTGIASCPKIIATTLQNARSEGHSGRSGCPDRRPDEGSAGDRSSTSRGSEALLLFGGVGKGEKESGLAVGFAVAANCAEVGQDDVPSDRETQAAALDFL